MHRAHAPAVMLEDALEWRRAVDVTDQPDRRRIEVAGDGHALLLGGVDDRLDRQVIVQGLSATSMDVADRGPDLRVGVRVDVLFQEVNEAAVALQDGQDAEIGARGRPGEEWLDPDGKRDRELP